ncbi:hypothetical protein [Winogradskyella ursingii]|uniref:hypothetical protein n=1 Tax=Winogradskyella ursingii TaxID=2686079 RepID=UPI0015CDCFBD|nr:hypothetical protein [Winogradskyella ursingii]
MLKNNIAILTTVANFELYKITSKLFPKDIKKYVIDGRDGMHGMDSLYYMFKKLKYEGIDWLIMADEDVIFKNSDAVFSIIDQMAKEKLTVAGVRDGGVVKHRVNNPYMINTFFSILNFKEVLDIWDKDAVKKNQYIIPNEFKDEKLDLKGTYDINNLYEPYYRFYLWLKRQGKKTLYLDADMLNDGISNTINYKNDVILYHTWYARSYGINEKHTKRINNILSDLGIKIESAELGEDVTIFKDDYFPIRKKGDKILKKIKNRLSKK